LLRTLRLENRYGIAAPCDVQRAKLFRSATVSRVRTPKRCSLAKAVRVACFGLRRHFTVRVQENSSARPQIGPSARSFYFVDRRSKSFLRSIPDRRSSEAKDQPVLVRHAGQLFWIRFPFLSSGNSSSYTRNDLYRPHPSHLSMLDGIVVRSTSGRTAEAPGRRVLRNLGFGAPVETLPHDHHGQERAQDALLQFIGQTLRAGSHARQCCGIAP
jgi:hypothetical protein